MSAPALTRPPTPSPEPNELLSLQNAATYVDVSERSMRRYIADGLIPAYRLPGRDGRSRLIRIRRADLDAALTRIPVGGGVA